MATKVKKRTTIIEETTAPKKRSKKKKSTTKKVTKRKTPTKKTKRKTTNKKPTKKKTVRKTITRTRTITPKAPPVTINMPAQTQQETGMNKIMLENFVSLQRVLTNLSTKMDSLTTKLGNLLDLFEISAKSLADREFEIEKDNKETLDKLNVLLDQNKVLARGLSLMHERMPHENFPHPPAPEPQHANYQQSQINTLPGSPMTVAPPTQKKSTLTRELNTSPPPFQQPPMPFGAPPMQQPKNPTAQEVSEPGLGPSPFTPSKTNTVPGPEIPPIPDFPKEPSAPTAPPTPPTSITDAVDKQKVAPNFPEDNDFSDIPDPEDLDLDAPLR